MNKTRELIGQKFYWLSLRKYFQAYIKDGDVCWGLKAMRHKPYANFQSLLVPTHWWKDFLIHFVIGLLVSTNSKCEIYDSILIIVDWLIKMVHYIPIKVTFKAPRLAKVILNMVVWNHSLHNSIITDRGLLSTSKFWSLFCCFFGIKRRLSTAFHPQTNGQKKIAEQHYGGLPSNFFQL